MNSKQRISSDLWSIKNRSNLAPADPRASSTSPGMNFYANREHGCPRRELFLSTAISRAKQASHRSKHRIDSLDYGNIVINFDQQDVLSEPAVPLTPDDETLLREKKESELMPPPSMTPKKRRTMSQSEDRSRMKRPSGTM
ncbi:hypothetical protein PROFUN_08736 [Planoprotostelium fungivorum]|uniref:Uncharacterized protein n=1 Tax=Planoprotostelium fungivorum TaxID=1890364 RepID=A0A2P6ND70_9EUKA|nr:hypothetical protein PROFUN_08736 [Planoprotostelium fungivorum]